MKNISLLFVFSVAVCACNSNSSEKKDTAPSAVAPKVIDYTTASSKDTSGVQDGESIVRYKNGVIKMRGAMKGGKRDGPWQSWYENGMQWSESIYDMGIKNGKTSTWYINSQKRYDGFYTNDKPSGNWIFYNEKGKKVDEHNYNAK